MQIAKKYFTESLIQLTILLSLIGFRVDIDSYLNDYYTPLAEINLGASSAYIQTPFHHLRDNLDGYSVHPKCPELDYYFASRRLLDEVRALGSPRFHTQLNTWLVHQVSVANNGEQETSTSSEADTSTELESPDDAAEAISEQFQSGREVSQRNSEVGQRPCGAGACVFPPEEDEVKINEEEPVLLTQLAHSSTLEEREDNLDGFSVPSNQAQQHVPVTGSDIDWNNFLSISNLDEFDSLVRESDLDTDITRAISLDVSLHNASVTSAGVFGMAAERSELSTASQQQRTYSHLESTDSSFPDPSPELTLGLTSVPFTSVCNLTANMTSHSTLGGSLDESVFDQINQLDLEDLDIMDTQLMSCLGSIDAQLLGDLDSDSGLSLENSSRGPLSPGSSEMSSSSSSCCDDECGATGYSSEVDSLSSKSLTDRSLTWPPVDLSEIVWHDHSYSSPTLLNKASLKLPCKTEECHGYEDEEDLDEQELSRDELRARTMCIPFTALQIVNMPVEEFMEILDSHDFSQEQVTLLRDIRRRGKNKLAAQNCRKRKLDAITGLEEEVERLRAQRDRLLRDKQLTGKTMAAVGQQIKQLTRDVLSRLRDDSGQPIDPERFTLQCGPNGRVVVQLIRRPAVSTSTRTKTNKRKKDKKQ